MAGLSSTEIISKLFSNVALEHDLVDLTQKAIDLAVDCCGADRGDILLWNDLRQDLIFAAGCNTRNDNEVASRGNPAPESSIIRELWMHRETDSQFITNDVRKCPNYVECDARTKSELVVLVKHGGRDLGVINLESFEEAHFTNDHADRLSQFANVVGRVIQPALERTTFRGVRRKSGITRVPPKKVLSDLLQSVIQPLGIDAGHIMLVSEDREFLEMVAYFDSDPTINPDLEDFQHTMNGPARTVRVFESKTADFCQNIEKEKDKFDEVGLERFKISGSWLGVPLMSGTEAYGVMAFWNRQGSNLNKVPISLLQRISRLLVTFLERWSDDKTVEDRWNQGVASIDQTEPPGHSVWNEYFAAGLKYILLGALAGDFDRIRVFRFDRDEQKQRCVWAFGHKSSEITIDESLDLHTPYNDHLVNTAFYDRSVRVFNEFEFGPDKNAEKLQKPAGLSWVQMPLVIDGQLYGQITVDKAFSKRPVFAENLEVFDLTGRIVESASDFALMEKRSRTVIDELPVVAWEKDLDGVFTYASGHFKEIMTPKLQKLGKAEIIGLTDRDLFPKMFKTHEQGDHRARNDTFVAKEKFERADGTTIPVQVIKGPVQDSLGNVIGTHGLWWDTTEMMSDIEWTHETASMGTVEWELKQDREGKWAQPSPSLYKIFGLSPNESQTTNFQSFYELIEPKDRDEFIVSMGRLMAEGEHHLTLLDEIGDPRIWELVADELAKHGPLEAEKEHKIELHINRPGEKQARTIQAKFKREPASSLRPGRVIMMAQDVTDIIAEKDKMLREVHHRIRNQIMSLENILTMATTRTQDNATEELLRTMRARMRAMGLIHDLLYQSKKGSAFGFDDYVNDLVDALSPIFRSEGKTIKIDPNVAPILLTHETATPCGMIVTELITNSFKHAFPDRESGTIKIQIDDSKDCEIVLQVIDDGIGIIHPEEVFQNTPYKHSGMELVHGLVRQLEGTISVESHQSGGTIAIVTFPNDHRIET